MLKKRVMRSLSSKVTIGCKDHEDYRAIHPPKEDCLVCWKIYATRMRFMVRNLKVKLKELKDVRR